MIYDFISVELDVPTKSPWLVVIHKAELKVAVIDAIAFDGLVLRKGAGQYLTSAKIHVYGANVMTIEATHTVAGNGITNFNLISDAKGIFCNKNEDLGNYFQINYK